MANSETYAEPLLNRWFRRAMMAVSVGFFALLALFGVLYVLNIILTDDCTYEAKGERLRTQLRVDNPYFCLCKKRVYVRGGNHDYFPLDGYDPESFEALPFRYARDKDRVYYVAIGGNDVSGGNEVRIVPGADPKTFQVLEKDVSRDERFKYEIGLYDDVKAVPLEDLGR